MSALQFNVNVSFMWRSKTSAMPHYNSTKYVSHIIKPNIISYHSLLNDSANQIRLKCHHSRLNLNFFQQLKIFLEAILTFVIWENFVSSKVIFRRWFWQMWFGKSLDLANFFLAFLYLQRHLDQWLNRAPLWTSTWLVFPEIEKS